MDDFGNRRIVEPVPGAGPRVVPFETYMQSALDRGSIVDRYTPNLAISGDQVARLTATARDTEGQSYNYLLGIDLASNGHPNGHPICSTYVNLLAQAAGIPAPLASPLPGRAVMPSDMSHSRTYGQAALDYTPGAATAGSGAGGNGKP
jgi:hypothetical protein